MQLPGMTGSSWRMLIPPALHQGFDNEQARNELSASLHFAGGQNEYVWQAWAMLESRCGNTAQARKLFDASLVANRNHAAAWHGWGLMEKRQGNLLKAKDIWMKVGAKQLHWIECALGNPPADSKWRHCE